VLPLPIAPGEHNVPPPNAGGDHHVLQYKQATVEVETWFMMVIIFTKTPIPIISDE
jgi:hypothetical protein